MMLLGTPIKHAMLAQGAFAEEVAERDPDLSARSAADAKSVGMDSGSFIADTVGRFLGAEDGESWATIMGNIQRSEDDPGYAFIETVLRTRLNHRCSSH